MNRPSVLRAIAFAMVSLLLAACAARPVSPDKVSEWDVVIIGDSTIWGVGLPYAALIEQQRGVKVRLHDMWQGGLRAVEILKALRGEDVPHEMLEELPDLVRDAEVLVVFGNPVNEDYQLPGDWNCVDSPYYARACSSADLAGYEADMSAIWAEVGKIRNGVPVVAWATDIYNPGLSEWTEAGVAAECTVCWENQSGALARAAAAHGIPFVSIYDAFNGPKHDEDPRSKGYIRSDGMHPSDQGAAFYAETLTQSGFEPVVLK